MGLPGLPWLPPRKVLVRGLLAALLAALVITSLFGLRSCQSASVAKTEARLSTNQTGAAIANGSDAVATVGGVAAKAAQSDRLTQENADAIRKAEGADAPVAAGARDAGLWALCRRAAYRGSEQCMQFTPAK